MELHKINHARRIKARAWGTILSLNYKSSMNSERYESVTLNYIRKNEWFRDYSKMEQNDENKFIKVFSEKIPLFLLPLSRSEISI